MTDGAFGRGGVGVSGGMDQERGRPGDGARGGLAQAGTASGAAPGGAAPVHQGFPPPNLPVPPLREAPARFGVAGISAGEMLFKTELVDTPDPRKQEPPDKLAQGLGWFSIGLGVMELANPRGLSNWLGLEDGQNVIRTFGAREVGNGLGILAQKDSVSKAGWVWLRVLGDALDLYALKKAKQQSTRPGNVNIAMGAVAGVMMLDMMTAALLSER